MGRKLVDPRFHPGKIFIPNGERDKHPHETIAAATPIPFGEDGNLGWFAAEESVQTEVQQENSRAVLC